MASKKFVIDFDIDDKNYRQKLDQMASQASKMGDKMAGQGGGFNNLSSSDNMQYQQMRMREMEKKFHSQNSPEDIARSQRRVDANPLTGMATKADHQRVGTAQEFEKFNKHMEKSHKLNKLTYYEDRTRHREFRSLSTRQLEVDTRKLRRSATKDEKGGKFDEADRKRRDVSAMETIINQRKGGNPQSRAMKQFGQNYFLSQMAGGITPLFGRGGGYAQGAGRMGMNAYGALRAGGQGKGMAIGGGIAAMLLGPLIKSFKDVKDAQKAVAGAGSFVGSGTGDSMASRFNNNMDHYSGQMTGMGLDRVDLAKGMGSFAKTGIYGGTSQEGLMHGVMAEHATEKALGLSSQIQQSYAKTGMYGDRQDNESALLGFSRFLESKGIGDVKVGIAPDGTVGDRNLTRVPEYLKRLVELNDQMFKVTGDKSKSQQNAAQNFMGSILGLGGIFSKTGDMAGETASGIRNSFANPKDALAQYKNIRAYRQGTGKTGVVGMMEAFENMDDPRVINQLMKSMAGERGISGQIKNNAGYNEQGFIKDVQQMFGLKSQTKARAFYNQFESQGGLRSTDMSKFKDASATKTMAQVAENLTLTLDKTGSAFADKMQAIASSLISGISQFVSAVGKFAALFGDDDIDTDTPTFETEEQAAFRRANYGNTNNLHGISTISGKQGPTKKSSSGNAGTMNLNEIRANSMEAYLKAHGQ